MIRLAAEDSAVILACDGAVLQRLTLRLTDPRPVLVDAAGKTIAPWEMELVNWPPEVEPALRRGGYLQPPQPELDLWCNCAD
ncbi:MAG: cytochrome P450 [Candidatus Contendobacter sp.]|jgi:hypothetical protein|nr:hypothetical protein [Gammaproteobacteria bacterium]MCC8994610.1 cytochrome P450 [Candidatus Contendobacter sp.]